MKYQCCEIIPKLFKHKTQPETNSAKYYNPKYKDYQIYRDKDNFVQWQHQSKHAKNALN
jgi:hypothetical protein